MHDQLFASYVVELLTYVLTSLVKKDNSNFKEGKIIVTRKLPLDANNEGNQLHTRIVQGQPKPPQHNYDTKRLPYTEPLAASRPTLKTSEEQQLQLPWISQRRPYMAPEEKDPGSGEHRRSASWDLESPSTMLPTE